MSETSTYQHGEPTAPAAPPKGNNGHGRVRSGNRKRKVARKQQAGRANTQVQASAPIARAATPPRIGNGTKPPIIEALCQTLPAKDATMTPQVACDWLNAAVANFRLAYGLTGAITIAVAPTKQ